MINQQLLQPESIVVIGGANNVHKPGGAVVRNILGGNYSGTLRIVNPKEDEVQGVRAFIIISAGFSEETTSLLSMPASWW